MKALFLVGALVLVAFEFLKVYFIMPFPGSQRMESLELAYFLHGWRWVFRAVAVVAMAAGVRAMWVGRWKWAAVAAGVVTALAVAFINLELAADRIFREPSALDVKGRADSQVDERSLVLAVEHNGEARAYPIRYLVYHHQVRDTVGGRPVLVTYCSVCRTGRVFEPTVDGRAETFRLVGMDHFNAMFEDATTGTWWRQATGEAVVGPLKGRRLAEVPSAQLSLDRWFAQHPEGQVMQPDVAAGGAYDVLNRFERGASKGELTRTDPGSWQEKSWVVGVRSGAAARAYDWNRLKADRIINDEVGGTPVVLVLAADGKGFAAYVRPGGPFALEGEMLVADGRSYDFFGRDTVDPTRRLEPVQAHQEFWHSWRTFQPGTTQFK